MKKKNQARVPFSVGRSTTIHVNEVGSPFLNFPSRIYEDTDGELHQRSERFSPKTGFGEKPTRIFFPEFPEKGASSPPPVFFLQRQGSGNAPFLV